LNGIGKVNYSFFPSSTFKKIDLFVNGSTFSMNSFEKDDGDKVTASFKKLFLAFALHLIKRIPVAA
jgi:hypothetical protein